jgi:hypothetical protein
MPSPYGLDIIESCLACKLRTEHSFCDLSKSALQALEKITLPTAYPRGAVLFVEGQNPRGVFVTAGLQLPPRILPRFRPADLTGPYFLRYSLADGTRPWEAAGDDLDAAIACRMGDWRPVGKFIVATHISAVARGRVFPWTCGE